VPDEPGPTGDDSTAAPDHAVAGSPVQEVPVRDDGIRLGQLLKLADLVESGSDAKALLLEGAVRVNGEEETRRGRQLSPGDVVSLGDRTARLV
jgi:ribosome-associated protein